MRTSSETTKLVAALVAARLKFAPVVKATKGQVGQNREYKYADLEALIEATMPSLLAEGVFVFQAVDAETATLITRLAHSSGEWAECAYPLTLNLPPQQLGSSLTYGRRYSLQSLLCLAAEDDDGKAASEKPEKAAPPKPEKVEKAVPAKKPAKVPAPAAAQTYAEWWLDMEATADTGIANLLQAFADSPLPHKAHMHAHERDKWNALKARAELVVPRAGVA